MIYYSDHYDVFSHLLARKYRRKLHKHWPAAIQQRTCELSYTPGYSRSEKKDLYSALHPFYFRSFTGVSLERFFADVYPGVFAEEWKHLT